MGTLAALLLVIVRSIRGATPAPESPASPFGLPFHVLAILTYIVGVFVSLSATASLGSEEIPGPVIDLQLSATSDSVTVSWSAPETGGTPDGYIVHISPEDGGKGKTKTPGAKKTQVDFKNLDAGRTYAVWVRAQNEAGKGERVHASITLPE